MIPACFQIIIRGMWFSNGGSSEMYALDFGQTNSCCIKEAAQHYSYMETLIGKRTLILLISTPPPWHAVECGDLPIPSNGAVSYSDTTLINSVATFTCSEGYIVTGDSTRTCLVTGMWSGIQPSCEREWMEEVYNVHDDGMPVPFESLWVNTRLIQTKSI